MPIVPGPESAKATAKCFRFHHTLKQSFIAETSDRPVLGPKRFEVHCEAYGATTIHLCSLAVQLWNLDFRCCGRIGCRNLEFKRKLILEQAVYVPTLAAPFGPLLV